MRSIDLASCAAMPSGFDRLHPALQHHVVNTLRWRSLRPLQEATIDPVLDGHNIVAVAPTAAGKTEAAVLPLLSAMLAEQRSGLSVLYICPLRALLNNLHVRIGDYCTMVGRRAGLWHGDVRGGARDRILDDPPDVLLTTPESLEVMLISRKVDHERLFANVRTVVVDEIHAFGGDDRGWHLLAVLERIAPRQRARPPADRVVGDRRRAVVAAAMAERLECSTVAGGGARGCCAHCPRAHARPRRLDAQRGTRHLPAPPR